MIDHYAPLLVPGRMADRMTEMQARRLASEARAGSTRTHWLTGDLRAAVHSSGALMARLRHVHVRTGPRISSDQQRA